MNTYVCFYNRKQCTVDAETSLKAQEIAATRMRAKHRWDVMVCLVGKHDAATGEIKQVTTNPSVL